MGWWRRTSIRVRLGSLYAVTVVAILLAYAVGVWLFVAHQLGADLDHRLREDFEVVESMLEAAGDDQVRWRGEHHDSNELEYQIRAEVWSLDGRLLLRTEAARPWADRLPAPRGTDFRFDVVDAGDRLRLLQGSNSINGQSVVIRVMRTEARMRSLLTMLALVELLGLPLAFVIAAAAGYLMARHSLRPVAHMTDLARTISADRLEERLPVDNPHDELGKLALVFNETFSRLERSFAQLRRFTADASHELRTPLTSIRSVGEVALRGEGGGTEYREAIGSMLEEVERLARLLDSLLTLSRADAGRVALRREPTDLGDLAREIVDEISVLAEDKEQALSLDVANPLELPVDPTVLRIALVNLIDNAIKHGRRGGSIQVNVCGIESDAAVLEVRDDGPGVSPEHRARIFERFYRVDKARARAQGGSGLGLSIARWAVEAHGGRIELDSEVGKGSTFRIVIPRHGGGEAT